MADTMEIIISAVDSASEVFQSIIGSAQSMADGVIDSVSGISDDFDAVADNVVNFQDVVDNIDESTIDSLADSLGMSSDEVERLIDVGANIASIPFDDASAGADELETEVEEVADAMEELGSAGDVFAATTFLDVADRMKDSMMDMADSAGNYEDSLTRMNLAAEGAGIPIDNMKEAVNSLSEETGRAGSSIRESFIGMTSAGITDMETMETVFKGASAQAFILGTDVQSLTDKFSGMAMKSTISEKTLKGTGVTMNELADALGMTGATADEVKEKWKELDTDQRAAALGMAASMNEGKDANNEYKDSWAGLQEQVNIAKGRLERVIGSVILPVVIPAMKTASDMLSGLGDIIEGVMKSPLGGLVSALATAAGAFLIVVTGVSALKSILSLLKIEAMLTSVQTIALAFAEDLQAGSSIASAAANAVGATGFGGLATAAWGAATAVWAALAPLLPFIAAAAAVVLVIYEVGKAFGWWTDVGSMIDAIWAGVQRLWSAFINNPGVQGAIAAISNAISILWGWIQQAGQAILEFFNINSEGNFDIVRVIIDTVGAAWDALYNAIMTVIGAATAVWDAINWVASQIWAVIGPFVMQIITFIQNIISTIDAFKSGQMSLPQFIWTILSLIVTHIQTMVGMVISRIVSFGSQMVSAGISAATRFVNGIVNWLRQLPGRVYSALIGVVGRISSAIQNWINTAKSKVSSLISGITRPFTDVPGKISNALSGVVDAITKPFQDAWNTVSGIIDDIKSGIDSVANWINGGAGGFELEDENNSNVNVNAAGYTVNIEESPLKVEYDINLNLDLINVPTHINTRDLINALKDKTVITSLTGNKDFQDADLKVKSRINSRISRQRGV